MIEQHDQPAQPPRSRFSRRGLVITAVAAAALFGGAAAAAADTAGDVGGDVGSSSSSTSTPAVPSPGTGSDTTDGVQDGTVAAPPAHTPHLDGEVSTVSSGSILITDHEGFTRTINVTDATTYGLGVALPIEVGETIHAEGSVAADGTSLDATVISLAPEPPAPGEGPAGGPGRGGPPAPPTDGSTPTPPTDGSAPTPPADGDAPALPTPPTVAPTS